jgi:hypothetical protein
VAEYMVKEEGKNGKVEVFDDRIVRTRKKTLGKDDVQTIPIKAVTGVSHDRKTLGSDEVKLIVGRLPTNGKLRTPRRWSRNCTPRCSRPAREHLLRWRPKEDRHKAPTRSPASSGSPPSTLPEPSAMTSMRR